jgi:glyoxylase-like metal-dependent hydrolase (beta-lactamase superfamily II)
VHETPFDGLPGTPFEIRRVVRRRFWREVALWWPEGRVLVAADALGTVGYMRTSGEPLGIHPMLRLWPPRRAFAGLDPEHILVGHGPGVHGSAAGEALRGALATSRRRIPRLAADGMRKLRRGAR